MEQLRAKADVPKNQYVLGTGFYPPLETGGAWFIHVGMKPVLAQGAIVFERLQQTSLFVGEKICIV